MNYNKMNNNVLKIWKTSYELDDFIYCMLFNCDITKISVFIIGTEENIKITTWGTSIIRPRSFREKTDKVHSN